MAKYLGIDYGKKRVGVAVSDEDGNLAFPHSVINHSPNLEDDIVNIFEEKKIDKIVIGESKNFKGEPNEIMGEIEKLKKRLEERTKTEVVLEPEFMTSQQAKRLQGENQMHDASSAAIILQSYLDKRKN